VTVGERTNGVRALSRVAARRADVSSTAVDDVHRGHSNQTESAAAGFLKPEVKSKKESPTLGHDQDRPIKPTVDGSRKTRETEDFPEVNLNNHHCGDRGEGGRGPTL
jgi:hypothetical protein